MSNKYIGRAVVFKPEWSFEDMGGEDCLDMTREQFDNLIGETGIITSVSVENGKAFNMNYYNVSFGKLGNIEAWSGCDLQLIN